MRFARTVLRRIAFSFWASSGFSKRLADVKHVCRVGHVAARLVAADMRYLVDSS